MGVRGRFEAIKRSSDNPAFADDLRKITALLEGGYVDVYALLTALIGAEFDYETPRGYLAVNGGYRVSVRGYDLGQLTVEADQVNTPERTAIDA